MQSRSGQHPQHGFRGLIGRYGVAVTVATTIALLAALGGSWGTAFGQTAGPQATPAAQVQTTQQLQPIPQQAGSGVAAGVAPKALPNSGEAPVSNEVPMTLAIAGVAALGAGFTVRRLSTRKR